MHSTFTKPFEKNPMTDAIETRINECVEACKPFESPIREVSVLRSDLDGAKIVLDSMLQALMTANAFLAPDSPARTEVEWAIARAKDFIRITSKGGKS